MDLARQRLEAGKDDPASRAAKAAAWDKATNDIDRYLAMPKAHEQVLRRGR